MLTEMDIIAHYFMRGFEYSTILSFLREFHDTEMSLRTLKNRLQSMGLKRRNVGADEEEVTMAIQEELNGPGCLRGYRSMWHCLRLKYGIQAPRAMVQRILRVLDPEGSDDRRAHRLKRRRYINPGPNYAWHVDGYDKLKPYGFPVHGCIDGFSRRILWLKVCRTNNDPAVTASFYLEYVRLVNGCPILLRTDCGTENGTMAAMQCYFRSGAHDEFAGINAHKYGSSHSNQRIENWWSYLRRNRSSWWINFFKDQVEQGNINTSDELQMECLWFCFSDLLQHDFDEVKNHWNTHYVRRSRFDTVAGRPDELYHLPENFGSSEFLQNVCIEQTNDMQEFCELPESNMYQEYFEYAMLQTNFAKPSNWNQALQLYRHLVTVANNGNN
jgi:hypothetical protein